MKNVGAGVHMFVCLLCVFVANLVEMFQNFGIEELIVRVIVMAVKHSDVCK